MTVHIHHLTGCTPRPLAGYLKALGILRLVATQADSHARGWWQNEHFVLGTRLNAEELTIFFLEKYAPTPFVSPWSKDGGFLSKAELLENMESSPLKRLAPFQAGIRAGRELCALMERANQDIQKIKNEQKALPKKQRDELRNDPQYKARLAKADREFKRIKEAFLPECRLKWRGLHLDWLDSAMILRPGNKPVYPVLFGSGGNDGRLEFTKIFMEQFQALFDVTQKDAVIPEKTRSLLQHALYGTPELGTSNSVIGMYFPGAAGGANSTSNIDGRSNVNPWDFLLAMEGALLFSAAGSRRLTFENTASVSAPFSVRGAPAGHLSASANEELKRGEQWMPLWERPSQLVELQKLLGEGRAQIERMPSREPVDLARAIARLGVSRGITSFERYAFLERNGQANFAVPLGRWKVISQPNQELLSDLNTWLHRFQRTARDAKAPARLKMIEQRLTDAVLAVTTAGSNPIFWQNLLLAIADADAALATGSGSATGILSGLRPEWVSAADDGSAELRLALAFAGIHQIRHHFLPLDRFGRLATVDDGKRLAHDPRVVCAGRDFITDAIAVVKRRLVEKSGDSEGGLDLTPVCEAIAADLQDVSDFLSGKLDTSRILKLARALMALDMKALREKPRLVHPPKVENHLPIDDAYVMLRFCLLPKHLAKKEKWKIPVQDSVFLRLVSGDMVEAIRQAGIHLKAHGHVPPIAVATGNARLLAASLVFPISYLSCDELHRTFIASSNEKGV